MSEEGRSIYIIACGRGGEALRMEDLIIYLYKLK